MPSESIKNHLMASAAHHVPAILPSNGESTAKPAALLNDAVIERRAPGVLATLGALRTTGRTGRRAHRSFWRLPLVRQAVVLDVARRNEMGLAFTHDEIRACGYSAAARSMTAADIDEAVAALGFERTFQQRRHGTWTPEYAADRYAVMVRVAGHAITSAGLRHRGGEGGMIRNVAYKIGDWRTFLALVHARHPDLPTPGQRTTPCGLQVDSQQEVVVVAAIRVAFPGCTLETQLRLPGEGQRWVSDARVDGRVYVEVLGVDPDEVGHDRYRRLYHERWERKRRWYEEQGVPLVVVTPRDVVDPTRLAACMVRLGALLARTPATTVPAGTARVRHVLGTWQDDATCEAAMRGLAERLGRRPTRGDVTQAGLGGLDPWIRRQGGMVGVTRLLDLAYVARPRAGERDKVARAAALACLAERYRADGVFPSSMRLVAADARPAAAIARLGGAQAARDALAAHLGVAIPAARRPAGWWTRERVLAVLRPLAARLGRLPTIDEAVAEAGGSTMRQAIHVCGGMATLRPLLDPSLPPTRLPRGHWERRDILVALARRVRQETGSTPTWQGVVRAAENTSVGHGIRRAGGMAVVLRWLAEDDAATALMDVAA